MKVCNVRQKFDHSPDLITQDRILQAELFIAKVRLTKIQIDLIHWELFDNFKTFIGRQNAGQKMRTYQIIINKKKRKQSDLINTQF